MLKTTLLVTAMLPLSGIIALAQDAAPATPAAQPETTAPAAAAPAAAPAETAKPAVTKGKDTLTVDFPDTEIREVLRSVADMFELNLVIPEALQGKTSIKLRDVTWRQVYQVVLQPVGYTIVEDGNIIKVVTIESLNLEPLTTEVFILNYAKASEIKPSLDSLTDAKIGGKIVVDARSNALIVTERGSVLQKMRPIVQHLDRPTEQVMIESKFIEVTQSDAKNIGVNWASLKGYTLSGSVDRGFIQENKRETDEIVTGDSTPSNATAFDKLFQNDVGRLTEAVFSAPQFSLVVSALQSQNDTKLISNPTVVTLNNSEATINMGDEIPIPNFTYNQEQGFFQISGFTYKPVGIILKVTPQVNTAGFIKLTVDPEVSTINDTKSEIYGRFDTARIPVISSRKTKTQVTMKDGYTLGIGGMIQKQDTKGQSKVPVLGNIPGLGRLFRSDSKNTEATNLVIFLTAKTIKPDGADTGQIFDSRQIRQMEIQKNDLPGFRDGSDPYYTPPAPEPKKKGWFEK